VQYQVNADNESIKDAMYKLTNARSQIESYVYDVVRFLLLSLSINLSLSV